MAFVDEAKIYAESGKGGDGVIRWLRTKETARGGPSGGDGGKGGDIVLVGVRDIAALYENTDQAVILKYAKRGDIKKLKTALRKEIKFMKNPNFKDSFKGVFGFHMYKEQDIENAVKGMQAMLKKI